MPSTVFNREEAQPWARNYEWLPYRFACFVLSTHIDGHGIINGFPTPTRYFPHRYAGMRRVYW